MISLNKEYLDGIITSEEYEIMQKYVEVADQIIRRKSGPGNDFLGWLDLPENYNKNEFKEILLSSSQIQNDSDVLIVIGIGGSYLGAKAVIDLLNNQFYNQMSTTIRKTPEIYFAGQNISSTYLNELNDIIGERDFSINVISKSGTTTEPAIAFRYFKEKLVNKYGDGANNRIYATTDASKGALKEQANLNNWKTFVVPDDVGGRFSVLTAVGLLPIAVSGIDIVNLMTGAQQAMKDLSNPDIEKNDAYFYAAMRNILNKKGKDIELLVGYEPKLAYLNEWWKQLFGESEGKNNKGIFPASVIFSTDLHSMGQLIQEGQRNLFETVINIKEPEEDLLVPTEAESSDGLSYLNGESIYKINQSAIKATAIAHSGGGVPNLIIEIDKLDPENIGYLIYFFELSCAMSGYLLGVNPFDQPGVESYKKNMFALLGKPGFEKIRAQLLGE